MTPLEELVEAINGHLPSYSLEEREGRDSDDVYLHHWRKFDVDEPDIVDRIMLAGEEVSRSRVKINDLLNKVHEQDVELKRRTETITKLVLALESSNQIAGKLTDILAKSVKP